MTDVEIPASVLEHSRFFDLLVELIPARYYHVVEAPAQLRYLPKEDREIEAELRKAKSKAAKRAKLDPDQSRTALQLQHRAVAPDANKDEAPGLVSGAETEPGRVAQGNGEKMEELKAKLHKRLEVFRQQREVKEKKEQIERAKEYRNKNRKVSKPQHPSKSAPKRYFKGKRQREISKHWCRKGGEEKQAAGAAEPEPEAGAERFSFGMLDFGDDDGRRAAKRQRKPSKAELLQEAEKKGTERTQLAASADGQAKLQKEAWEAARARAKGGKVYDDPKLLRKSLKKEEKQRSKSAAAWKEREQQQRKEGKERQQKRRENLQARSQAKQQQKVARREKKLMRAGFEGRRDTFINGP